MTDNATRSRALRQLVAILMRRAGFEDARHRVPATGRLSARVGEYEGPTSDIEGVPGLFLGVHADIQRRYGARVDAAEQAAALAGLRHAATVQYRREVDADQYLAVMSLSGFLRLLADARQGVRL